MKKNPDFQKGIGQLLSAFQNSGSGYIRELSAAFSEKDIETVYSLTHKINGTASMLYAQSSIPGLNSIHIICELIQFNTKSRENFPYLMFFHALDEHFQYLEREISRYMERQ